MKKILITFIGNNDCYLREGKEGAIIRILKERACDFLYILYNDTRYLEFASDILLYCKKKFPKLTVRYQEAKALNPIDYNLVYPSMVSAVKSILKDEGTEDVEYTISLTSGTPTMHSCWILIVMGGIIDAKMIQASQQSGVQDVDFSLDDFPQIGSEKKTKIELTKTSRENKLLRRQLLDSYSSLIGDHESIVQVKHQIDNLAKYDIPVFIGGESGTGKEIVSRLLHFNSSRKEGPFVAVNCGSVSDNLFESEFFGHKKGSFTGAIADHEGYFSQADRGTLFMDEVGDLPLPMQVKLLRVLEEGTIQPVGGKTKRVNVRIVAASNKDLNQLVQEGSFREDLFYRIVQAQIHLSSLRDRGSDILLLARHFLSDFSAKNRIDKRFSTSAESKLLAYHYPGNVRQLQNMVKQSYIHSQTELIHDNDIVLTNTPAPCYIIEIPREGIDLDNDIIPAYYHAALKMTNDNASEAARILGLKPHTFRARLKSLKDKQYLKN